MAYNEKIAQMTRERIAQSHTDVEEKAMFGGLCFMVNGKMCVGVQSDHLMVRLDPNIYEEVLEKGGCRPMEFTGKPMKGYVYVDVEDLTTQKKINNWLELALQYNAIAKASKKKVKK
jgi:TfoX/Sxy family transcriptional regulator of competence genes